MSPFTDHRENREFASEIKFLVTPAVAGQIRDWIRPRLLPDPHALGESGDAYQITSLYFDTPGFDVFRRKGSFGRSKYRIRRYGDGETVFLERKLKSRGLLAKRRSIVRLDELKRLATEPAERGWPGYWFQRRLNARGLRPVCQIAYRRTARVAMTPYGPIRLTLDEGLRAERADELVFDDPAHGARLSEGHRILELKYRVALPTVFKLLVEEFALSPQRVSKYRLAAVALGLVAADAPGRFAHHQAELSACLIS